MLTDNEIRRMWRMWREACGPRFTTLWERAMSDRELLQWAATAAGLTYRDDLWGGGHVQRPDALWELWNPLTDDSDALRLAVRLGLAVSVEYQVGSTAALWGPPTGVVREPHGDDAHAATRRAIVRAAAEIGRAMADIGERALAAAERVDAVAKRLNLRAEPSAELVRAARGAVEAMIDGLSPVEDGRPHHMVMRYKQALDALRRALDAINKEQGNG